MPLDWTAIGDAVGPDGADLIGLLKPYLPALARSGQGVFDGFIQHTMDKNWAEIDKLMYEKMTVEEREELDKDVLSGARQACIDKVERIQLAKDIGFKIALRLVMMVAL